MRWLAGALVATLLVVGPAATADDPVDETDPSITDGSAQQALDAARTRWQERGSRSYRITVRVSCFCPPDVRAPERITVRNAKPVGQVQPWHRRFATVPRLFKRVQEAIDNGAAQLDVEYGVRGIPRQVFVDLDRMIADEEVGFGARRYRALT